MTNNTPAPADLVEAVTDAVGKVLYGPLFDFTSPETHEFAGQIAEAAIATVTVYMSSDEVIQADRDAAAAYLSAIVTDMPRLAERVSENGTALARAFAAHRRAAAGGIAPSRFIKPTAVVGNLRTIAQYFERLLAMPSDEQPHFPKGMRPFSNGDLRDLADACATAANELHAVMRTTPQPDPRDAGLEALPYQAVFNAISAAVAHAPGSAISISVVAFKENLRTAIANSEGKA